MKYFNITVIQYIYDIFLTYRDRKIPTKNNLDPNKFEKRNSFHPWGVCSGGCNSKPSEVLDQATLHCGG